MKKRLLAVGLGVLVLGGVALASELEADAPRAGEAASRIRVAPSQTPLAPVAPKAVVVTISSVTLGEECGESPDPEPAPAPEKKASMEKPSQRAAADSSFAGARARRACEQTSMQLAVRSGSDAAAADIKIKKVELFSEKGKLIGTLKSRGPSTWSAATSAYQTWDEKSVPGTDLSVRYVLSAPDWSKVKNRWDKTYTVKVTLSVGGADQKLERETYLVGETTLPPGVVT